MTEVPARPLQPVRRWLVAGMVMIACMVMLGGITRLTGSGLSITEWKPIIGALPPLSEAAWNEAFHKYKAIPEYRLINQQMDLAGFKHIFFWEYLHRNWGRLMGLVFVLPFILFWRRGLLKGWLMRRSLMILVAGGLVGALGWFMVASGLEDAPDVSHFRLAIHLCAAFSVFGLVAWTWFDLARGRRKWRAADLVGRWGRGLLVLLAIQIIWGAFTAGLDAGRIYNTWPLMHGEFMPGNVLATGSLFHDLTDHRDGVQWVHRTMAWLVAGAFLVYARALLRTGRHQRLAAWSIAAVLAQFVLGVLTVLTQVKLAPALLHQLGGLFLLGVLLRVLHATGTSVDHPTISTEGRPVLVGKA